MKSVLVPLDGSTHAMAALPVARALAKQHDASLRVLHVGATQLPLQSLVTTLGLTPDDVQGIVLEQTTGDPAERIVQAARDWQSELIVMCTRTHLGHPRGRLGDVAEHVLLHAPCPVVLVRPERGRVPWDLRRIVVPHDGTPGTAAALHSAIELAERSQADLDMLHVPTLDLPDAPDTVTAPLYVDQPQHEWPMWAREFVERTQGLCGHTFSNRPRIFLRRGTPESEILRFTSEREGDLLVLAWHGHLGPNRAKVLKRAFEEAPCPILVLRVEQSDSDETNATRSESDRVSLDPASPEILFDGGLIP